jgi:DNA-3-methyladenine glycosylase II
MQRLYGLGEEAGRPELERLAERWRPWRSAASWYLWRSL